MEIYGEISKVRAAVKAWKKEGLTVGFVPTMGYLHEGHKSLIDAARKENDRVVVSIFVNPMQFGPTEDLESYPRDLKKDAALCEAAGVDIIFHPEPEEMYADGFCSYVDMNGLTTELCGKSRPIHFRGVQTVVLKLFHIVTPDRAYFGQKDAQQLAVIRRMVKDLNVDTRIIGCPIIREADGLAKSSRNTYLSAEERKAICEKLGIDAYDIYGLTEVYGPGIGISCDAHDGIHYWDDFIYVEIIDPQTGETLPDGEWGEIVITTLRKEGAPLIRFRTHDLSRILPGDCPCGSKFPRLDTIQGRTDDMVKIKGVNLFPAQIEEILKTFPEVSSEYQIHISHLDGKDTMRLYVETNGSIDFLDLAKRIAERVKSRIGFTPLVKVVEIGVLPRSEKKTKRVIDTRYE